MKKLLLKTILVAAAMCVGMNAWGQTITGFTKVGGFYYANYSDDSQGTTPYEKRNYNLAALDTYSATKSKNPTSAGVNLAGFSNTVTRYLIGTADTSGDYISGMTFGKSKYGWFVSVGYGLQNNHNSASSNITINDVPNCYAVLTHKIGASNANTAVWAEVDAEEETPVAAVEGTITLALKNKNYSTNGKIASYTYTDIDVYTPYAGNGTATTYTIKYVDSEFTELKTARSAVATTTGSTYSAEESDLVDFFGETNTTKKYTYVSGNESRTAYLNPASNVISLIFREQDKYTATLLSDKGVELGTATNYKGESVSISYPRYSLRNGTLYEAPAQSSTYAKSITLDSDGKEVVMTYSPTNTIDVVYYSEGENLSGVYVVSPGSGNNINSRGSGQKAGATSGNGVASVAPLTITTLPVGKYKLTACVGGKKNQDLTFYAGETLIGTAKTGDYVTTLQTTDEFTLDTNTDIKFTGGYQTANSDNAYGLDLVYIVRTDAAVATIGANGYTTVSRSIPLALGSMTASTGEVTAYYAKAVGDGKVTMKSIEENVEAGEGLILKGTAGATITIPVAASGSSIDNYLVGCPTATELTTPNSNYYVLVNNGENVEFQSLTGSYTDNKVTIPAGKAYLNVATAGARLSVVFDEETTGVQELKNSRIEGLKTGNYYNLSGQRVAQPTKGLYIVNGKKVIKN